MGETTGNPRVRVMAKQCSLGSAVKGQWMAVRVLGFEHYDAGALELGCGEGRAKGTSLHKSSVAVRLSGCTDTGRRGGAARARNGAGAEAG